MAQLCLVVELDPWHSCARRLVLISFCMIWPCLRVCVCACAAEGTDERPLEAERSLMTSKQALGRFGGAQYSGPLGVAVLVYPSSILRMRALLAVFVALWVHALTPPS